MVDLRATCPRHHVVSCTGSVCGHQPYYGCRAAAGAYAQTHAFTRCMQRRSLTAAAARVTLTLFPNLVMKRLGGCGENFLQGGWVCLRLLVVHRIGSCWRLDPVAHWGIMAAEEVVETN